MRPCVIKVENAWLRFIKVVSVNSSVQGRITMNNKDIFFKLLYTCVSLLIQTNSLLGPE